MARVGQKGHPKNHTLIQASDAAHTFWLGKLRKSDLSQKLFLCHLDLMKRLIITLCLTINLARGDDLAAVMVHIKDHMQKGWDEVYAGQEVSSQ